MGGTQSLEASPPSDGSVDIFAGVCFDEGTLVGRPGAVKGNFTAQQFDAKRAGLPEGPILASLAKHATDLRTQNLSTLVPAAKSCLILCNSYTKPNLKLGPGPISDSLVVAQNHAKRGFACYFLHNPMSQLVRQWLPVFFSKTKVALTVFFTGHGASVPDTNGDESDRFDEAMIFDDGHILDDDLREILVQSFTGKARVLLLTDCCHSGSIWDLQSKVLKGQKKIPPNILSFAATRDNQTAKQMTVNGQSQGIFSFYFWQAVNANPKGGPKAIASIIDKQMARFNQKAVVFASSPVMEREPLFK
jgi:hypothetical protein